MWIAFANAQHSFASHMKCLLGVVLFGQMESVANLASVVQLAEGLKWATVQVHKVRPALK